MTQHNLQKGAAQEKTCSKANRIGHWARVGVMFISGGFIFPHAMTEDDDARRDANRNANKTT
jgi:hypothetical protein